MTDYDDSPTFVIETGGGSGAGAFLLGALVGAAAALLMAPRSGSETQAEIVGAARRLRNQVEGRVGDARDSVAGRVERTRGGVSSRVSSVRDRVETRVDQARAALEAGRSAARDAREGLERRLEAAKRSYRDDLDRSRDGGSEPEVVVSETPVQEDAGDLA